MRKISVIQGDITQIKADAIVNASNTALLSGGERGVTAAIHRVGGEELVAACKFIRIKEGGCAIGKAVLTTAGKLPARFVIHTVGPLWQQGRYQESELLASCYRSCLEIAEDKNLKIIAFPNISTGIHGFPKTLAAEIALKTVSDYLEKSSVEEVIFVCHHPENYELYQKALSVFQV